MTVDEVNSYCITIMRWWWALTLSTTIIFLITSLVTGFDGVSISGSSNVEDCTGTGDNKCGDPLGYQAIQNLHLKLDDDGDGHVDISESDEFLREELEYADGQERQKGLHLNNKKSVTVQELWETWKKSEVHNWTVEETMEWLKTSVDLPQYAQAFLDNSVDGTALPRLASNLQFLSGTLGIRDRIHKQKISVKAMDAVLFGPPKHHNYIKDGLLVALLVIAVGGCWFAYLQHRHSQNNLRKMLADMESLQKAEETLTKLQKELDHAKQVQQKFIIEKENLEQRLQVEGLEKRDLHGALLSSDIGDASIRIELLEDELRRAKEDLQRRQFEQPIWGPPPALQLWMQLTHELELQNYNIKKTAAVAQLQAAKEACEKLGRHRSNLFKFVHAVHSNSAVDDVEGRIMQTKNAILELERELRERSNRWRQIELLCGFSIVANPGLIELEKKLHSSTLNGSLHFLPGNQENMDELDSLQRYPVGAVQQLVHASAMFLAPVPGTYLASSPSWPSDLTTSRQLHTTYTATSSSGNVLISNGHIASSSEVLNQSSFAPEVTGAPTLTSTQGLIRPASLILRGSSPEGHSLNVSPFGNVNATTPGVEAGIVLRKPSAMGQQQKISFTVGESPSSDASSECELQTVTASNTAAAATAAAATSAQSGVAAASKSLSSSSSSSSGSFPSSALSSSATSSSHLWHKQPSLSQDSSSSRDVEESITTVTTTNLGSGGSSHTLMQSFSSEIGGGAVNGDSQCHPLKSKGSQSILSTTSSLEEEKSSDSSSTTTTDDRGEVKQKKKRNFFRGKILKFR